MDMKEPDMIRKCPGKEMFFPFQEDPIKQAGFHRESNFQCISDNDPQNLFNCLYMMIEVSKVYS